MYNRWRPDFGGPITAADLDGDGFTDLVVGNGPWDSDDGGTIPPPRLRLLKGTEKRSRGRAVHRLPRHRVRVRHRPR
ncbi:FG-GAP repeat protein [Streptomyces mirabilis]|uniref:FG-GAP repeat protein n=1 Tax=Streptomyces mirabilis TaxID=68239 RepID=UPI0036A27F09